MPDSVSPSELVSPDGVIDTPASVDVTVSIIPSDMRDAPLEAYAEKVAEAYETVVEATGYSFELLRGPEPALLSDLPAVAIKALLDNTIMKTVVTTHEDYVYRLALSFEQECRDEFEPLLETVLASCQCRL